MEKAEIQKRNEKAQNLRVLQTGDQTYYVESEEGKVCYRVDFAPGDEVAICTCGDYARGSKQDPFFNCKHILAVMNSIPSGEIEKAKFLEKKRPTIDPRFITTIEGRDFVLFGGLLDASHQKGLLSIEVEPLQFPTEQNNMTAICKATVMSKYAETFSDIGDASPTNCHPRVAKHLLRMSSTRAIARALRSYVNSPMTCLEELGDLSEVIGVEVKEKIAAKKEIQRKATRIEKNDAPSKEVIDVTPSNVTPAASEKKEPEKGQQPGNGNKAPDAKNAKKVDGNGNGRGKTKQETVSKISSAQANAIANLSRRRGISVEELEKMSVDAYGVKVEHLSQKDASGLIRTLQQSS